MTTATTTDDGRCIHLWIRDQDRLVCTHCGEALSDLPYTPADVTVEDQERGW